jgi:hypothetical protein
MRNKTPSDRAKAGVVVAEVYVVVAEVYGGAVVQACGGSMTKVIRTQNSNETRH